MPGRPPGFPAALAAPAPAGVAAEPDSPDLLTTLFYSLLSLDETLAMLAVQAIDHARDTDDHTLLESVVAADYAQLACGVLQRWVSTVSGPGHFTGVATVVLKLCNIVQPDVLLLGEKDYQQLQVVRRMLRDLDSDVEVRGCPLHREPDGLAMSSRNGYLSPDERARAVGLSRALGAIRDAMQRGGRDHESLCGAAARDLTAAGWRVDYVAVRNQSGLAPPGPGETELVVLGAAWMGRTRLIDNLEFRAG